MSSNGRTSPQRILVVEDEPAVAETIAYALKTEGFEPIHVCTGAAGLKALESGGIALIVLDVGLPDGNGFDFCRTVRSRSEVPIVFLTARHEEVDRILGLELGGDEYLEKPFSPRVLTAHVRAVLRRTGRQQAAAASPPGPFRIDEERRVVVYRGVALDLTPYEFAILREMVRRPGQVFSAERILDIAGAENSLGEAARQHVKSIRRKLRAVAPDADPIETRHGFGYVLVDEQ